MLSVLMGIVDPFLTYSFRWARWVSVLRLHHCEASATGTPAPLPCFLKTKVDVYLHALAYIYKKTLHLGSGVLQMLGPGDKALNWQAWLLVLPTSTSSFLFLQVPLNLLEGLENPLPCNRRLRSPSLPGGSPLPPDAHWEPGGLFMRGFFICHRLFILISFFLLLSLPFLPIICRQLHSPLPWTSLLSTHQDPPPLRSSSSSNSWWRSFWFFLSLSCERFFCAFYS